MYPQRLWCLGPCDAQKRKKNLTVAPERGLHNPAHPSGLRKMVLLPGSTPDARAQLGGPPGHSHGFPGSSLGCDFSHCAVIAHLCVLPSPLNCGVFHPGMHSFSIVSQLSLGSGIQ